MRNLDLELQEEEYELGKAQMINKDQLVGSINCPAVPSKTREQVLAEINERFPKRVETKCECGAHATSFASVHSTWCPLYTT